MQNKPGIITRIRGAARLIAGLGTLIENPQTLMGPGYTASQATRVRGNNYDTYSEQVEAIRTMFLGQAEFGSSYVAAIIRFRAQIISGNGVNVRVDNARAQDWVDGLILSNALGGRRFYDLTAMGEAEGRCLLNLYWDAERRAVNSQHLSWYQHKYEVMTDPANYEQVTGFKMPKSKDVLDASTTVYVRTGGLMNDHKSPTPCLGTVLTEIVNLDRALADWRALNHLYGVCFPYWKTENWSDSVRIMETVNAETNPWQIGHAMAAPADFYYPGPPAESRESLKEEILVLAKKISGATGVAIHHLGFVDLFGTKAGAEEVSEAIYIATSSERDSWQSGVYQFVEKAARIHTEATGERINLDGLTVTLPIVSASQLKSLVEVYLTLAESKIISKRTIREMVPNIDPETEEDRIEAEKAAAPAPLFPAMVPPAEEDVA